MEPDEIRDYAFGVMNFGGILAKRLPAGAMTERGVSVAAIRLRFKGLDDDGNGAEIVAYLTRDQVSELAQSLVEMVCDG